MVSTNLARTTLESSESLLTPPASSWMNCRSVLASDPIVIRPERQILNAETTHFAQTE
jgi:hypothetical protein